MVFVGSFQLFTFCHCTVLSHCREKTKLQIQLVHRCGPMVSPANGESELIMCGQRVPLGPGLPILRKGPILSLAAPTSKRWTTDGLMMIDLTSAVNGSLMQRKQKRGYISSIRGRDHYKTYA
jgi:hypothetical protein